MSERPKIWATSDQHYGHGRIIESCKRPFANVAAMNEELVRRHNSFVQPGDVVWHLGDFSFMKPRESAALLARLNGQHHLVLGNHDRTATAMLKIGFLSVQKSAVLQFGEFTYYLAHRPEDLPKNEIDCDFARFGLCGHVHTAWTRRGVITNVGVDAHDFTPIRLR